MTVFYCFITREWYSYHFPELVKIVSDNYMYARTAQYVKSRKDLTEDMIEGLEEIVMDSAKAKAIYDASKSSMGRWTDLTGIIIIQNVYISLPKTNSMTGKYWSQTYIVL